MFKLEFETDNAQYRDSSGSTFAVSDEIAFVAIKVRNGHRSGQLRDVDGNIVGRWELSE